MGALSIIGLPPMAGTWSKWYLLMGALEADKLIIVLVLTISTLLNVAYLLPIPIKAFFAPGGKNQPALVMGRNQRGAVAKLNRHRHHDDSLCRAVFKSAAHY